MAKTCPKCNAQSGDAWVDCQGSCPMPGSPDYDWRWTDPRLKSFVEWRMQHPKLQSIQIRGSGRDPLVTRPEARMIFTAYDNKGGLVQRGLSYAHYSWMVNHGILVDVLAGPLPGAMAMDIAAPMPDGRPVAPLAQDDVYGGRDV